MIVAIVRFAFPEPMSLSDAQTAFEASAPSYQSIPGLLGKHYLIAEDGTSGGGVYFWESKQHAMDTYTDAWRERLAQRYGAAPSVEFFESPVSVNAHGITVG